MSVKQDNNMWKGKYDPHYTSSLVRCLASEEEVCFLVHAELLIDSDWRLKEEGILRDVITIWEEKYNGLIELKDYNTWIYQLLARHMSEQEMQDRYVYRSEIKEKIILWKLPVASYKKYPLCELKMYEGSKRSPPIVGFAAQIFHTTRPGYDYKELLDLPGPFPFIHMNCDCDEN